MALAVTGVGAVTALGATAEETWTRLLAGERGFRELSIFEDEGYRTRLVAEVPGVAPADGPEHSRTSELALRAATEAMAAAALPPGIRVGLVVGGTTAGMLETESLLAVLLRPQGAVDPEVRKEALGRMLSHPLTAPTDRVARALGPFARVRSVSSACSGGANAIAIGATWLELGLVDAVLCGAADALCRVTLSGFSALGSLDPEGARPFDRRRRGLTLGEGAGFIVLEPIARAEARGKEVLCALAGWAARSEHHHITNPEPSGDAPARAMSAALTRAGLLPADLDYVNAHGTGTPLNDPMESRALARVLGEELARVPVSSCKGQIGHTLAAAGAVEAVITTLAIARGVVPPTGGLAEPDPECPLRHVTVAEARPIRAALSSSFGFGGMDTVLVLARPDLARVAPPPAPRGVVVTGAATLTPAGLLEGARTAELPGLSGGGDAVSLDWSALLDADRARRLDRASRLAAVVAGRALGREGAEPPDDTAGVVVGSAFGALDATAAFMRRLREKGARFVAPAEFPSLVPSSPAGHASIYLGLGGPAMVVADLGTSGECALLQGFEAIAAGEAERVCVAAVEERSAIVEAVLSVLFGARGRGGPPRREGAAALALASDAWASAHGAPVLARVERALAWTEEADPLAALAAPPPGAVVVLAAPNARVEEIVSRSSWSRCARLAWNDQVGGHEAVGGIALAVAAGVVARGDAPAALCVGSARGWGYAVVLGSADRAS